MENNSSAIFIEFEKCKKIKDQAWGEIINYLRNTEKGEYLFKKIYESSPRF